jgi:DNA-binding response OmpR family regulator
MRNEPRVLIIEDDDVLRAMMFTILRYQSVEVDTARDAEEALEKVRNCDYAFIVIDADLPDRTCETFLERFRATRPGATSFVLAVRDPKSEATLDSDIVSAVLIKPLEIATLADIVRECSVAVPPPEDPLPCPQAESSANSSYPRDPYITN